MQRARERERDERKRRFTILGKARRTGLAIPSRGPPQQKGAGKMPSASSSESSSSSDEDTGSDTEGATAKPTPTKKPTPTNKPKRVEGADNEASSEEDGLPRSHDVEHRPGGRKNRTVERVNFQTWVRPHHTVLN